MTIVFEVRDPVSVNRKYGNGRSGRLFLTPEYRAFKNRVTWAAMAAAREGGWPRDPWLPAEVRLSYQLYGCRLDSDAPRKPLRDACEKILYAHDGVCSDGPAPLAIMDGGPSRVVVTVELLSLRSPQEAAAKRAAHDLRIEKRARSRQKSMTR